MAMEIDHQCIVKKHFLSHRFYEIPLADFLISQPQQLAKPSIINVDLVRKRDFLSFLETARETDMAVIVGRKVESTMV